MEYLKTKLEIIDGIKSSKIDDKIAQKVTKFYTNKPFPNYKSDDDKITISEKGNKNYLASKFKEFVGYNKKILEVGCGTGQLSIYFSTGNNNQIVSLDATLESLKVAKNFADKNNINNIEFVNIDILDDVLAENFFDFIWCNGVLHHTHDTEKAISEVFRVLRPGGRAVIMLYSKHSFLYWVNLFLLRGVLMGGIFRDKKWLGRSTEWMSEDKQEVYNPETKVYSQKRLRWMFNKFDDVKIRKVGFIFEQIPLIGKYIGKLCGMVTGYNESGILIYDKPWRNETKLELILSRYIGFANNISAIKR